MVTAELALASLGVTVVVVVIAWVVCVLGIVVRCQGTATEVARQLARGDSEAAVLAERSAPPGARVRATRSGDQLHVVVCLRAQPWASWLPAVPVEVGASVLAEPKGES